MLILQAFKRKEFKRKVKELRKQGKIPAVLYGPHIEAIPLIVERNDFAKVFQVAGESSLVTLQIDGDTFPVLIRELQRDPLTDDVLHVDFYQPPLDKEIEVMVPLIFEGQPAAVRDLGGTLIRNIQEVSVSALPQDLPHEIRVSVESLKTFEDRILLKDLAQSEKVKILGNPEDIVAQVVPPEKVEEELARPVEEKVEAVEMVEKEKKEKEEAQEQEEVTPHAQ